MKFISLILLFTFLLTKPPLIEANVLYSSQEGRENQEENSLNKKLLVLIIASDDEPIYVQLQAIWREYMHLDSEHVEAYFVKADPHLETFCEIKGDIIWSKGAESLSPGIINKTLLSMEIMLPRLKEFAFILRTNLSSFYFFPKLLKFLNSLPQKNCYCACKGYHGDIPFGSGAGFILSPDLVELLVKNKAILNQKNFLDDVAIGSFFQKEAINILPAKRLDILTLAAWLELKDQVPDYFHFRLKNIDNARLSDELYIQKKLLKILYDIQIK